MDKWHKEAEAVGTHLGGADNVAGCRIDYSRIPHTPWFINPTPTRDGQAVIENGTDEGGHIAVCEWHIAEFIVKTVNEAHQRPD